MSLKSLKTQLKNAIKVRNTLNKAVREAKKKSAKSWYKVNKIKGEIINAKNAEQLKKKLIKHKKDVMPLRGAMTVYKKVYDIPSDNSVIATLLIPAKAKRNQNLKDHQGWKCRASEAKVLDLTYKGKKIKKARSGHSIGYTPTGTRMYTIYEVGKTVKPKRWFKGKETCAGGIHFFMQRLRAVAY